MLPLGIAASQTNACGRGLLRVKIHRSGGRGHTAEIPSTPDELGAMRERLGRASKRLMHRNKLRWTIRLFDDLVNASEQSWRNSEAQRFGGLEINHQLEFCGLLDG
jgi:hypothetical protein